MNVLLWCCTLRAPRRHLAGTASGFCRIRGHRTEDPTGFLLPAGGIGIAAPRDVTETAWEGRPPHLPLERLVSSLLLLAPTDAQTFIWTIEPVWVCWLHVCVCASTICTDFRAWDFIIEAYKFTAECVVVLHLAILRDSWKETSSVYFW